MTTPTQGPQLRAPSMKTAMAMANLVKDLAVGAVTLNPGKVIGGTLRATGEIASDLGASGGYIQQMGDLTEILKGNPINSVKMLAAKGTEVATSGQDMLKGGAKSGGDGIVGMALGGMEKLSKGVEMLGGAAEKGGAAMDHGSTALDMSSGAAIQGGKAMAKSGALLSKTIIGAIIGIPMMAVGAVTVAGGVAGKVTAKATKVAGKMLKVVGKVLTLTAKAMKAATRIMQRINKIFHTAYKTVRVIVRKLTAPLRMVRRGVATVRGGKVEDIKWRGQGLVQKIAKIARAPLRLVQRVKRVITSKKEGAPAQDPRKGKSPFHYLKQALTRPLKAVTGLTRGVAAKAHRLVDATDSLSNASSHAGRGDMKAAGSAFKEGIGGVASARELTGGVMDGLKGSPKPGPKGGPEPEHQSKKGKVSNVSVVTSGLVRVRSSVKATPGTAKPKNPRFKKAGPLTKTGRRTFPLASARGLSRRELHPGKGGKGGAGAGQPSGPTSPSLLKRLSQVGKLPFKALHKTFHLAQGTTAKAHRVLVKAPVSLSNVNQHMGRGKPAEAITHAKSAVRDLGSVQEMTNAARKIAHNPAQAAQKAPGRSPQPGDPPSPETRREGLAKLREQADRSLHAPA